MQYHSAAAAQSRMFSSDPAMPQLRIAGDAMAMREVLSRILKPINGGAVSIDRCALNRFRYRPGGRAILLYDLLISDPATGRKGNAWVTGFLYPDGKARQLYKKLRKAWQAQSQPGHEALFEPASYDEALDMTFQVFPFDRHLPALAELIGEIPDGLQAAVLERFGEPSVRLGRCETEPARYRPMIGAALRLKMQAHTAQGAHEDKNFYVKLFSDDSGARTFDLLSAFEQAGNRSNAGFSVSSPVSYLSEHRALVTEGVSGTPLHHIALDGGDVTAAAKITARAVAALHQSGVEIAWRRDRLGMLDRAEAAAKYLRWGCPFLQEEIDWLLGAVERDLTDAPLCPAHLDLKPEHVFIDGDRVSFIDFDSAAAADPVFDAAVLYVELLSLAGHDSVTQGRVRAASQVFLEAYFAEAPNEWRARLPVNIACAALKSARIVLQNLEADWPDKIAKILALGVAATSGGIL